MQADLVRSHNPPPGAVLPVPTDPPSKTPRHSPQMHITLPAEAGAVRNAIQDLRASPVLHAASDDLCSTVEIVLAEVLNNIVEHAYARISGQITVLIQQRAQSLWFEVTDTGDAMPGLALPAGQLPSMDAVDDLPEGGFGWFLIRSLTTGLQYRRIGAANRLSFRISADQSGT